MEQNELLIERREAVEWVTLNRPASGNALNAGLVRALIGYFESLRDREEIRIVVLRSSGKHFCVGADLTDGAFASVERTPHTVWAVQREIARIYLAMRKCPQPRVGGQERSLRLRSANLASTITCLS